MPLVVPQWGREKSSKEVFQQHKLIFKMPASHGFDSKHMLLCSPGCVVVTCLTFLKMPQYAHLYFFFFFLKERLVLFFPFKSALISTLHTTRHAVSKFVEFVSCAYGCLSAHTRLYPSTAGSSRSFSHANFDSGLSVFRAAAALAGSQVFT